MSEWLAEHMDYAHRSPSEGRYRTWAENDPEDCLAVHEIDHNVPGANILVEHEHKPLGTFYVDS